MQLQACTRIRAHGCRCTPTNARTHRRTRTRTDPHIRTHTVTHTHTRTHTRTSTQAHTHTHARKRTNAYTKTNAITHIHRQHRTDKALPTHGFGSRVASKRPPTHTERQSLHAHSRATITTTTQCVSKEIKRQLITSMSTHTRARAHMHTHRQVWLKGRKQVATNTHGTTDVARTQHNNNNTMHD